MTEVVAVIEPPSAGESHWIASCPALHYHVQGASRRQVIERFEADLPQVLTWLAEEGIDIKQTRQLP